MPPWIPGFCFVCKNAYSTRHVSTAFSDLYGFGIGIGKMPAGGERVDTGGTLVVSA